MDCPHCKNVLHLKSSEAYKTFYLCTDSDCPAISIIITSTQKDDKYGITP